MGSITELEDSLNMLLKVMASAIAYLSRKSGHTPVNAQVPLTVLGNTEALPPETLEASRDELVQDLISQAKDVQRRIDALPSRDISEDEHVRGCCLMTLLIRIGQCRTDAFGS